MAAISFTAILVSIAISTALSMGMRLISSLLSQGGSQPQYGGQLPRAQDPGTSLTVREAAAPQKIVFGTRRVPGTIVFAHCTQNNRLLHLVVVWAGHEISSYGALYFGDEEIPLAVGQATNRFAGYVGCEDQLGDADQGAFGNLIYHAPELWTAAHRGRGIACSYITLHWSRDLFGQFDIGKIWRVVNGMEVFDPRDDTTAFSNNAALCVAAWMNSAKFGRGVPYAEIYEDELIAAANVCDETVTLAAGGSESRYTCNALLTSDTPFVDNLTKLLSAMHGECGQTGGAWAIRAGAWEEPELTFDESHFREPFTVTNGTGREGFNAIKGKFANPAKNYQPDDFPAIVSAAYEIEDGGDGAGSGRVFQDVSLDCTTSASMAQRIARIDLRAARQPLAFTAKLKLHALRAVVGKNVAIDFDLLGWSAKAFRVKRMRLVPGFGPDGQPGVIGVDLDLIETAEFIYDWSASDEITADPAPNTTLPDVFNVLPITNLMVTEDLYETREGSGVKARGQLTWTASPDAFVELYQPEYKLRSASDWIKLPRVPVTTVNVDDMAPGAYDFRVAAVNVLGVLSAYEAVVKEISGLSAAPQSLTGLSLANLGGMALLRWTLSPDLDVRQGGQILLRHAGTGTGGAYSESVSIAPPVPGGATQAFVPLKAGTYLLMPVDASGNPAASPSSIESDQATVLAYSPLDTQQEHPTFAGTKSAVFYDPDDGKLKLAGLTLVDDIVDWDAVTDVDFSGGVAASGTYGFAAGIDLGAVERVRLTTDIVSLIVNQLDAIDDWTGNVDARVDWDGTAGGDADLLIEFRETDDDPAGAPVWSAWGRLDVSERQARGFEFRGQFSRSNPAFNIHVSELAVTAAGVV